MPPLVPGDEAEKHGRVYPETLSGYSLDTSADARMGRTKKPEATLSLPSTVGSNST